MSESQVEVDDDFDELVTAPDAENVEEEGEQEWTEEGEEPSVSEH